MSLRLDNYILFGEIINRNPRSTFGFIVLRGRNHALRFELVGDPEPDLCGRHVKFSIPVPDEPGPEASDMILSLCQVGVTGIMTTARMYRVPTGDRPLAQYISNKQPVPGEWRPTLTIEWYSQQGRVIIQIPDPVLEVLEGDPLPEPQIPQESEAQGLEITDIHLKDDESVIEHTVLKAEMQEDVSASVNLDTYLEQINKKKEQNFIEEEDDPLADVKIFEHLWETEPGEPIGSLLNPRLLPKPEDLTEEKAESVVKSILAEMAILHVTLDICEHFTWKRIYQFMLDELFPNMRVFPQMCNALDYVHHFTTWESCEECMKEYQID